MKQDSVRTTVDIPAPLYRKLKAQAAANGSSRATRRRGETRRVAVPQPAAWPGVGAAAANASSITGRSVKWSANTRT